MWKLWKILVRIVIWRLNVFSIIPFDVFNLLHDILLTSVAIAATRAWRAGCGQSWVPAVRCQLHPIRWRSKLPVRWGPGSVCVIIVHRIETVVVIKWAWVVVGRFVSVSVSISILICFIFDFSLLTIIVGVAVVAAFFCAWHEWVGVCWCVVFNERWIVFLRLLLFTTIRWNFLLLSQWQVEEVAALWARSCSMI